MVFLQDGLLEGVRIEAVRLGNTIPIADLEQQAKKYSCLAIVGKSSEPHIAALLNKTGFDSVAVMS